MDIVSANVANTMPKNVTSTLATNVHKKLVYKMDCYILHTVLLVIIFLFIIAIICHHYAKHRSKLWLVQNHCVFDSIKEMDLLEFMMKVNIFRY